MFTEAPARGHVIRVLRAPEAAGRPRQVVRRLRRGGPSRRGGGCLAAARSRRETRGSLARKLTPAEDRTSWSPRSGAVPGDAVLCAVGPRPAAAAVLGEQRSGLGRELGLADPGVLSFCWVVDFPMFERNPETGAWDFSHNPFSMPQGGLEALTSSDPGDILAYQYDLVCNGVELSSGAVRNHLPEVMEAAFAIAGYGPERIRESFPGPVERLPLRAAAPRRHRPRVRPHPDAARGPGQPARGDRLPAQPGGPGPADGGAQPGDRAQLAELHLRVVPPGR